MNKQFDKVWIYQADRALTDQERDEITRLGTDFVTSWNSHGNALDAEFEVRHNRFLLFFVNQQSAVASGCSIDSSVHFIRDIQNRFKLDLLDRMKIPFKSDSEIFTIDFTDLSRAFDEGVIDEDTPVFNNAISSMEQFTEHWVRPFGASVFYTAVTA